MRGCIEAEFHAGVVGLYRDVLALSVATLVSSVCLAQEPPSADELLNDLACGSCHEGIPVETDILGMVPDLSQAGMRYSPAYLFRFLRFPVEVRQHIGFARMPTFHLDERESLALVLYIAEQLPAGSQPPAFTTEPDYETARSKYPEIGARDGRRIFLALKCVGCHEHSPMEQFQEKVAPDLSYEGARVTSDWLQAFLDRPTSVRASGFYPGSGSRMPDFRLTATELDTLTAYLQEQRRGFEYPSLLLNGVGGRPLSPGQGRDLVRRFGDMSVFRSDKAVDLLRDKLPCLGCHRLGDEGGKTGPDLSSLNSRLRNRFLWRIVRDPLSVVPSGVMPHVEMPEKTLDLIEVYLQQQQLPRDSTEYVSLTAHPPHFFEGFAGGQRLYTKHCAVCHGVTGDADGFNVRYLPTLPTQHSDSSYMSTRPDDTVFDGIYAGGYILNKSNRMPPWGFTLERSEIWGLVSYIRQLCRCEGPAWSRDNRPPQQ